MSWTRETLLENKIIESNLDFLKGQSSKVKHFAQKGLASLASIETSAKARGEVVEQARMLCEDYIYNRLATMHHWQRERYFCQQTIERNEQTPTTPRILVQQVSTSSDNTCVDTCIDNNINNSDKNINNNNDDVFSRSISRLISLSISSQERDLFNHSSPDKVGMMMYEKWQNRLTDVSSEVLSLGQKLEQSYPYLYDDLASQLKMPLRSDIAVTKAMTCIGDYMFQNNFVTWYRIMGMFAVAGAVAVEAIDNQKGHLITTIVHVFSQIIERHASLWICRQGGWVALIQEYQPVNETYRQLVTIVGFILGFAFVIMLPVHFFY